MSYRYMKRLWFTDSPVLIVDLSSSTSRWSQDRSGSCAIRAIRFLTSIAITASLKKKSLNSRLWYVIPGVAIAWSLRHKWKRFIIKINILNLDLYLRWSYLKRK